MSGSRVLSAQVAPLVREACRADARWDVITRAYLEHGPRIARRILALTGDPTSVDDLVNETFVQAFESLPRYEGRSELSTWLHGIAINLVRTHLAKRRRRQRIDATLLPEARQGTPAEAALRERQAAQRLYAALWELPDELREAFVLCVIEQRSLKDAAEELGVPISTLHARRQRAEARVRARLEQEGEQA